MISFGLLKQIHVAAAVLSIAGFLWRAGLMLRRSPLADRRWVQTAPHYVDSVLLLAALGMLLVGARNPFAEPWLVAKISTLFAYIVCGALALKRAPGERAKRFFLVLALVLIAHLLSIALARDPWGLIGWFRR